ncbi:MAG: MAPEG family protein [Myxococcota bacterium]|nr:MAPEG family protein [Myxococcales bacterium]
MEWVAFVIVCALIEYMLFGIAVGRARAEYGVAAPAITGHPAFERTMRAHQNTLENLVVFVPAIAIFGVYVSPALAALVGVVWIVGRFVYFRGYVEDAPKRAPGVLVTVLCNAILAIGGGIGALVAWL